MAHRLPLLVLATSWLAAGCIFPEPEKFEEPQRTAPIVALNEVAPPVTSLLVVNGRTPHNFTVPFRSNDAGEFLQALFFLDFNTSSEDFVTFQNVPPSTLDDPNRSVTLQWTFDETCTNDEVEDVACCRQFSMHLVHVSSVEQNTGTPRPDEVKSSGDLASVVWWMAVEAEGQSPHLLGRCPSPLDD
jgi:hypothetical protein